MHPDDFRRLEDLAKFPFTTKADLRDNYPFELFAVPREQSRAHPCFVRARPASRPLSATHKNDIDVWAAVMARSIVASGGRPGMVMHNAYGYGLFTGGLARITAASASAAQSFPCPAA